MQAEFGIGNSALLIEFNAGQPVMAVAATMQHSPFVIMARLGPDLQSIRDLEGKTVMAESHSDELTAYLTIAGLEHDRILMAQHSGKVSSLQADGSQRADAMTAYISTEPFQAARLNIPYQIFNPRDLNINFYGDTLFTSQQFARQHVQAVSGMRDALVAGWRYALTHQAEIVDLILRKYQPGLDRTELRLEAQATYNLFQTDIVDISYMSRERLQHIGEIYAASGMMPKDFFLKGFMFTAERRLPLWVSRALFWGSVAILCSALLAAYIASLNRRLAASLKKLGVQAEKLEVANDQLARLSSTDPLTGLFNRRYLDEALARKLSRAGRSQGFLSMLMVDVDHFKRYNDALGHPAGDDCLKQVAEVLRHNVQRSGEFAARIGGEEFAVAASHLNASQALALAERILHDIAAMKIPHPASEFGLVTVSIGLSRWGSGPLPCQEQLIAQADAALYRAKQEGRNRCVAA